MRKKIQLMKHIQTNLLNNAQPSGQSNLAQEKKKKKTRGSGYEAITQLLSSKCHCLSAKFEQRINLSRKVPNGCF